MSLYEWDELKKKGELTFKEMCIYIPMWTLICIATIFLLPLLIVGFLFEKAVLWTAE